MRSGQGDVSSAGMVAGSRVTWKDARAAVLLLSGKWVLDVLSELSGRPRRYAELRRSIRGIREKVLTDTLQRMESQGLVSRDVIRTEPPTTGWRLTPLGRSLAVPVASLAAWTLANRVELTPRRALAAIPAARLTGTARRS